MTLNWLRWPLLILAGLFIYGQTFHFDFVFDDRVFIVNNPTIRDFGHVYLIWHNYPMTRSVGFYSFAFNYHLSQLDPHGYHIFNFCVHLIATGLVWALANLILRSELSFIIAFFFLVHPCQTQAVSYIAQRFESMATVFYLATMYCYLAGRIAGTSGRRFLFFAFSGFFTMLGILTKEVVITVPLMMLAAEWILFPKTSRARLYLLLVLGGILLYLLFTKLVYTDISIFTRAIPSLSHDGDLLTPWHYLLTQMRVFLTFLRLLVLPIHQNLDYDYPASTGLLTPPLTAVGLCAILGIIFLIFKLRRDFPVIAFGLAWIIVTFSINLAPRANVIFEHKLYLISFGFFLSFVATLAFLIKDRRLLMGIFYGLILLLALISFERNKVWKDELTLWNNIVEESPHKAAAYVNRAFVYKSLGKTTEAMADYTKAIEVNPKYADAYYNRGLEYYRQGDLAAALADDNKGIAFKPFYFEAYNNRGLIYFNQGHLPQALSDYNKAININSGYAAAYNNRAIIYYELKEYGKAWQDVRQAQQLGMSVNPGFLKALKQAS